MEKENFETADIRNRMSPITTLIELIELIDLNDKTTPEMAKLLQGSIDQSKKSINYLCDREVYK